VKTDILVGDAMTENFIEIDSSASLRECANIMAVHKVGALIVKSEGSWYIVTEQDMVRKGLGKGLDPERAKVVNIMSRLDYTLDPGMDIFEAMTKMTYHNIRHLPVFSKDKMVGLLTSKDVLKIEPKLFGVFVETFDVKEHERKPIPEKIKVCGICGNDSNLREKDHMLVCDACV